MLSGSGQIDFYPRARHCVLLLAVLCISVETALGQEPPRQAPPRVPAYSEPPHLHAEPIPAPVPDVADDPDPLSLDDVLAIAEQSSPVLAQAAAEIEMARGRAWQAGLYPNPMASGGAMQLGGRESQYYAALSQEIVTKHKLRLDRAIACQEVTQAELKFVRARFELLTQVRQVYAAALAADRRVLVLEELFRLAQKSRQTADQLVQGGEGARPDAILFEIELEKADVMLSNARVAADGARRRLAAIAGQRNLQIGPLSGNLAVSFDRLASEIAIDDYVPQNASVLVAEADVERARLAVRRAEVEPFPNVTVEGGYMYQVEGLHDMAIVNLSLPLPLWDKNQGNIYAARADITRASAGVGQAQNEVARQMADAVARFRAAHEQARRYEERILPKAAEGVRLIQQGFESGEFDLQRLLQAQRSLVEADLGFVGALEERWNAAAELAGLAQVEAFP